MLAGSLVHGDVVPSSRALSAALGVSRGVVVAAYEQLAGEGYLEMSQGADGRIAAVDSTPAHDRPQTPTAPPAPPVAVNMLPGFPSTTRLDERAWRAAWRLAAAQPVPTAQADDFGTAALRAEIADHVRQARGLTCDPADVLVTAGTSEAVMLLALALGELHPSGASVAMEDPGYPSSRRTIERFGGTVLPVPVDGDGLRIDALAALDPAPHAVLLTPSHQYPLGGRLPVSTRLEILEWAQQHDALVIEDDYDSEFRHGAATLPALATLDRSERVALVGSFSKVLTPWLRLGYIVLPRRPELHAALRRVRGDVAAPIAGTAQEAMAALLASGAVRRHIAAVRRDYAHRRELVIRALGDLAGSRLRGLEGGLHGVVELPTAAAAERVRARRRRRRCGRRRTRRLRGATCRIRSSRHRLRLRGTDRPGAGERTRGAAVGDHRRNPTATRALRSVREPLEIARGIDCGHRAALWHRASRKDLAMVPEINYWAVILATLSSMVVGSIWYTPKVFGNYWMKQAGITPSGNAADAIGPIVVTLFVSFITAWVLAGASYIAWDFYGGGFLWNTVFTAGILWAGFTAARFITHDAFDKRPSGLTILNIAHELVTVVVMAVIIGAWVPAGV